MTKEEMLDKAKKKATKYKMVMPSLLIKALAAGYLKIHGGFCKKVEDINYGLCFNFAEDFCQIIPEAKWEWVDGVHCVIILNGKYYDAEVPDGVDNYKDLPYFQRELATEGSSNA